MPYSLFYDRLIIADQEERQLYLASREELTGAGKAFLEMEETLQNNTVPDFLQKQEGRAEFFPDFRKEEYEKAVEQMIAYIEEGDILYCQHDTAAFDSGKRKVL